MLIKCSSIPMWPRTPEILVSLKDSNVLKAQRIDRTVLVKGGLGITKVSTRQGLCPVNSRGICCQLGDYMSHVVYLL